MNPDVLRMAYQPAPRLEVVRCQEPFCGRPFQPRRMGARYCSSTCRSRASRNRNQPGEGSLEEASNPHAELPLKREEMRPPRPYFIPVKLQEQETVEPPTRSTAGGSGLELVLPSGAILRLSGAIEPHSLRPLLRALKEEGLW